MRFPDRPAVVVDLAAVQGLDPFGNWQNELWTDQRHVGELLTSLTDRGVLTDDVEQPGTFVDAASLLPVTWTFAFLRAVSAAVAVVSGAGLLMLLAARQRRQEAAYVLMSRMGLSRRTHRRSLAWELGGLTGTAWLSGTVAAGAALLVATAAIDVDPGFLPPTLVRLPVGTAAWSALGLGCLAVVLVVLAQRRADRADPGIVLRE
jgi:hypothetical protein